MEFAFLILFAVVAVAAGIAGATEKPMGWSSPFLPRPPEPPDFTSACVRGPDGSTEQAPRNMANSRAGARRSEHRLLFLLKAKPKKERE